MVYVDPLTNRGSKFKNRPVMTCHLFADDKDDLLDFAGDIGLSKNKEVNQKGLCHFNLTPEKRDLAIKKGATPLRSCAAIRQWWRIKDRLNNRGTYTVPW